MHTTHEGGRIQEEEDDRGRNSWHMRAHFQNKTGSKRTTKTRIMTQNSLRHDSSHTEVTYCRSKGWAGGVVRDSCCVSVQGLRPLKDSAFAVFEGESFRDLVNPVSCC